MGDLLAQLEVIRLVEKRLSYMRLEKLKVVLDINFPDRQQALRQMDSYIFITENQLDSLNKSVASTQLQSSEEPVVDKAEIIEEIVNQEDDCELIPSYPIVAEKGEDDEFELIVPSYFSEEQDDSVDLELIPSFFFKEQDESVNLNPQKRKPIPHLSYSVCIRSSLAEIGFAKLVGFFNNHHQHTIENCCKNITDLKGLVISHNKLIGNDFLPLFFDYSRTLFDRGKKLGITNDFSEFFGEFCLDTSYGFVLHGLILLDTLDRNLVFELITRLGCQSDFRFLDSLVLMCVNEAGISGDQKLFVKMPESVVCNLGSDIDNFFAQCTKGKMSNKLLIVECPFMNMTSARWIYDRGKVFDVLNGYFSFASTYKFGVDTITSYELVLKHGSQVAVEQSSYIGVNLTGSVFDRGRGLEHMGRYSCFDGDYECHFDTITSCLMFLESILMEGYNGKSIYVLIVEPGYNIVLLFEHSNVLLFVANGDSRENINSFDKMFERDDFFLQLILGKDSSKLNVETAGTNRRVLLILSTKCDFSLVSFLLVPKIVRNHFYPSRIGSFLNFPLLISKVCGSLMVQEIITPVKHYWNYWHIPCCGILARIVGIGASLMVVQVLLVYFLSGNYLKWKFKSSSAGLWNVGHNTRKPFMKAVLNYCLFCLNIFKDTRHFHSYYNRLLELFYHPKRGCIGLELYGGGLEIKVLLAGIIIDLHIVLNLLYQKWLNCKLRQLVKGIISPVQIQSYNNTNCKVNGPGVIQADFIETCKRMKDTRVDKPKGVQVLHEKCKEPTTFTVLVSKAGAAIKNIMLQNIMLQACVIPYKDEDDEHYILQRNVLLNSGLRTAVLNGLTWEFFSFGIKCLLMVSPLLNLLAWLDYLRWKFKLFPIVLWSGDSVSWNYNIQVVELVEQDWRPTNLQQTLNWQFHVVPAQRYNLAFAQGNAPALTGVVMNVRILSLFLKLGVEFRGKLWTIRELWKCQVARHQGVLSLVGVLFVVIHLMKSTKLHLILN